MAPGAAGELIQATLGSVRFVPRPRIMLRMIDLERLTIEFAGHCREDQANAFVDLAVC